MPTTRVTAAVLIIGDEILSGRTRDTNLSTIAGFLAPLGVTVAEARIVADIDAEIIAAVNALRERYDYLLTTGGIGPTHDDITADAVAAAFGVEIGERADALAILQAHYHNPADLTPARKRMARIPDGASLIANPVSGAPGFQLANVFVLAGVPAIMRAMLEDVAPRLQGGRPLLSRSVRAKGLREGEFAADLEAIARAMPDISFGSYPFFGPDGYGAAIVARGEDAGRLDAAVERLVALAHARGLTPDLGQA
jgi:molybdenum cofactor synthesis domain-containing protein